MVAAQEVWHGWRTAAAAVAGAISRAGHQGVSTAASYFEKNIIVVRVALLWSSSSSGHGSRLAQCSKAAAGRAPPGERCAACSCRGTCSAGLEAQETD